MPPDKPYPPLVEGLVNSLPQQVPYPLGLVRVIETHISWVILAGRHALKIKKPVNFGFLDFSTLSRRKEACEKELRINRRYSPDIYIEVITITGSAGNPTLDGDGAVMEYAVKMRRFPSNQLFSQLATTGHLLPKHIIDLALQVARFHNSLIPEPAPCAQPRLERAQDFIEANFTSISTLISNDSDRLPLATLHAWTRHQRQALREPLLSRSSLGFIRECHGDLHLGNIVLLNGRPRLFDGIEFNDDLRWIDTMSEIAFTVMDLEEHGLPPLAYLFLNRYLELTGDFLGVVLLDYYRLYRAMVRAKVATLQLKQTTCATRRAQLAAGYHRYIGYGLRLIEKKTPHLVIMHGLSGSGKSYLASQLATEMPAVRIRSDAERKRLFGENGNSAGIATGLYSRECTDLTYQKILDFAHRILSSGHSVILDATFLKHVHRRDAQQIAKVSGSEFFILNCEAPIDLLSRRIRSRQQEDADLSDANESVLRLQLDSHEPLLASEQSHALTLDMSHRQNIPEILSRLRNLQCDRVAALTP